MVWEPPLSISEKAEHHALTVLLIYHPWTWAARYNTWLLIELTPKGVVFSFLSSLDNGTSTVTVVITSFGQLDIFGLGRLHTWRFCHQQHVQQITRMQ